MSLLSSPLRSPLRSALQYPQSSIGGGIPDKYMLTSGRAQRAGSRTVSSAGQEYIASQSNFTNVPYATLGIRLAFSQWYCDSTGEHDAGNSRQITGISVVVGGVRIQLANSAFTVPDGGDYIFTDDTVSIPANANYGIIVSDYVVAGGYRCGTVRANGNAPYSGEASLDRVATGATTRDNYLVQGGTAFGVLTTGATVFSPVAICAKGWWVAAGSPPVSVIVGDSRGNGDRDSFYDVPVGGVFGSESRALNDNTSSVRRGFLNLSVPGTSFAVLNSGGFGKRAALLAALGSPFSRWLCEMGVNDAGGALANAPAAYAYLQTINPVPIVQLGILPYVDSTALSTYGFTDSSRMTIHADFQTFNEAAKNTLVSGKIAAFIDNRGIVDTTAGSGVAKGSQFSSTVAVDFVATTLTLNAAPALYSRLYATPGTATFRSLGIVSAVVDNGNSTYTCSFRNGTLTGVLTAGTVICDQQTEDGLHYFTEPTIRLMAPIIAAKVAGVI